MNKKIVIIIVVLFVFAGLVFLAGKTKEPTLVIEDKVFNMEESREIAENWIVNNSPTYVFDGYGLSLADEGEVLEGRMYYFVFSFESRAAGYGDRTDQILAQVITSHAIEVVIGEGEVISAITDGVYDEIKGEMIEETTLETMKINLYLVQVVDGQEEIVGVEREVPYTIAVARASVEELLKGPLLNEEAEGLSTAINKGTQLQSIEIEDGVAFVDFNERLQEGVAGSARVMAIRSQIEKTLLQFDAVDEVVISIEGRTEDILQP